MQGQMDTQRDLYEPILRQAQAGQGPSTSILTARYPFKMRTSDFVRGLGWVGQ